MFTPESIKISIQEGNTSNFVEFIEESIKKHSSTKLCPTDEKCDFLHALPQILDIFIEITRIYCQEAENIGSRTVLQACLKFLKVSCAHGKSLQGMIAGKEGVLEAIKIILNSPEDGILKKWTWHLLVNVIVGNSDTLRLIWSDFGDFLLTEMTGNHENTPITAAVLYNCLRLAMEENVQEIPTAEIFRRMIGTLERNVGAAESNQMDFVHLSFEYVLSKVDKFRDIYSQLNGFDRTWTIFYITDHVKDSRQPQIEEEVLKYLPGQFNKKSQCILNSSLQYEEDDPKEVMALLRCFVAITGSDTYGKVFKDNASLFINTSALLVAVHQLSSQENSQFKPLGKLEDFSTKSQAAQEAEKEVFFELKTLLVRLIANLSHKNRKNQDLARELNVVLTICSCTTMDARNPMMKEWAIVALKNLLEGNLENQNIIKSMVNTGPAANNVLSELTMENGTVRINRNQEQ
ncbi:ataxin-10 [Phlebotomus papatasi]|uniref:ataxin-10 n=1 Tax=Phlebotomus papatasi TaxID=29031 RepID=UPI0024843021|nr:ataxin-10 [Phlebotomus papatasi]